MNEYEVYQKYLALRRYFYSNYDYHKYAGKTKTTVDAYMKRNDRFFFKKLSKEKDPLNYIISNLIFEDIYVIDLFSEKGKKNYDRWCKITQSLSYTLDQELSSFEDLKLAFQVRNGQSEFMQRFYQSKISPEVLATLLGISNVGKYWDKHLKDDPLWNETYSKYSKYATLLEYDKKKMLKILKKHLHIKD